MKKEAAPKEFGVRPILMRRWDGGMRIIHTNGRVEWTTFYDVPDYEGNIFDPDGCTSRKTQKAAYQACLEYDRSGDEHKQNLSAFLGYL